MVMRPFHAALHKIDRHLCAILTAMGYVPAHHYSDPLISIDCNFLLPYALAKHSLRPRSDLSILLNRVATLPLTMSTLDRFHPR